MTPTVTMGVLGSAVVPPTPGYRLFTWGAAANGLLGNGTTTPNVTSPTQIGSDANWQQVSLTAQHALAIKGGKLYAWGHNGSYQLGDNTTTTRTSPVEISADTDWQSVAASAGYSLAVKGGKLFTWGSAASGVLGNGTTQPNVRVPTQIGTDTNWLSVQARGSVATGIKTDGTLWVWGSNSNGGTARGFTSGTTQVPTKVGTDTDWLAIRTLGQTSIAIKTNGKLYSWGSALNGRLGNGTTSPDVLVATQVGSATDWVTIGSGVDNAAAIKSNGTLWWWGWENQVAFQNVTTPTQIGSDSDWSFVGHFFTHWHFIKTNKTLWARYANSFGQIGDGSTSFRASPVQVGTAADWVMVSGGTANSTVGLR